MTSADVQLVLEAPDRTEQEGRYQVAYRHFLRRFGDFPVKVVYAEEQELVVVSVYPLKRSYRR